MLMTEIDVIYENGVFKILSDVKLKEGTKGKVIIKSSQILEIGRKYRTKVDKDVMQEFLEERK